MQQRVTVAIDGIDVDFTNVDRIIWPQAGISKADLLAYHSQVAPVALRFWRNRLLTVTRYPNGIEGEFFYQKSYPKAPAWVTLHTVASRDRETSYIVADGLAVILWLANQSAIEIHPSTGEVGSLETPSYAIVDLDPTEPTDFADTVRVAYYVKDVLEELQLSGYPKTSGATGLHIYIPLLPRYSFAQTAGFVQFIGDLLAKHFPKEVTVERLVKKRKGVYVDHLQNASNKTIVGVFSPRPVPQALVSTPVTWGELETITPADFTLSTVMGQALERQQIFLPVLENQQSLTKVLPFLGS